MSVLFTLKPNALVAHPSGSESFGTVPDMPKFSLPGGEIYLRVGEHFGPNSGYGVMHVWEAHRADLAKHDCLSVDSVAGLIARMIVPGAQIYCEFKELTGGHRVAVLKNALGSLILQPRNERRGFGYYVVTWYPQRRAHGTLVGNIARPK